VPSAHGLLGPSSGAHALLPTESQDAGSLGSDARRL